MDKKKLWGILALVAVLAALIVGASVLYSRLGNAAGPSDQLQTYDDTEKSQTNDAGTTASQGGATATKPHTHTNSAPDFTVYDANGRAVNLSDYVGKPIVLNFWASWCGPCQSEMPDFNAKCRELDGKVQFLMVNMTSGRETVETAKAFIESKGYTFPVLYDTDSDAAAVYSVYSLPTTYFIDAAGNLVAQAAGAIDGETLQRGIDMIFEG